MTWARLRLGSNDIPSLKKHMDNDLFDFERIKRNREFAQSRLQDHNFLIHKSVERVLDNLRDIQRDFKKIAVIGSRGADILKACFPKKSVTVFDIVKGRGVDRLMKDEIPDLKEGRYDCVIVLPYLHTVNNVPAFLQTVKLALKPDGLFLCCLFGGTTIQELRQSIMQVELKSRDGAGQHIHPMIDHYQFAGLLQSAGFALPVVDYDRVHVRYSELITLYKDIIGMGEGNALIEKPQPIDDIKSEIENYYRENFYNEGFVATFDILHGIGWSHHESQQQPARRGSGEVSLTEIL